MYKYLPKGFEVCANGLIVVKITVIFCTLVTLTVYKNIIIITNEENHKHTHKLNLMKLKHGLVTSYVIKVVQWRNSKTLDL